MSESAPTAASRTYEIEFSDGTLLRFDIPETWKVTYGPIVGPANTAGEGTRSKSRFGGNAFRAWESDNKQRLLLTGVTSFRDVSLPMIARCVRRFGTEVWFLDDGSWFGEKAKLVEKAWKSPEDSDYSDHDPANGPENRADPDTIWRAKAVLKPR